MIKASLEGGDERKKQRKNKKASLEGGDGRKKQRKNE